MAVDVVIWKYYLVSTIVVYWQFCAEIPHWAIWEYYLNWMTFLRIIEKLFLYLERNMKWTFTNKIKTKGIGESLFRRNDSLLCAIIKKYENRSF